jgi:nicotinate-nucleotide adenylyltransferase
MAAMPAPLGVFGGTFDPIHCGHLELAREIRFALQLAAVRIIPAGDPPHRAAPVATAVHRLAMVELAVEGSVGLEVDRREVDRPGRSFTVLTLLSLRDEDPARPLALIVGADAFLGFPGWHRWREIFNLAHVVVVARPGSPFPSRLPPVLADEWEARRTNEAKSLHESTAGAILVQPITPHDISASAIRTQLGRGAEGIAAVRGLLPPAVLAYIDRNQLYRSRPDAP